MKSKKKEKDLYKNIQNIFEKAYVIFLILVGLSLLFFISNILVFWKAMPTIIIFIIIFNIAGQLFYFRKKIFKFFSFKEYKNFSSEEKKNASRKEIKKSATKVAIETMLSPWPMVDAVIVLTEVFYLFFMIKKIYSLKLGSRNSFIFFGQVTASLVLAFQMERYDKYIASALRTMMANAFGNITSGVLSKVGVEFGKSISNATMISWLGLTLCKLACEQEKSKKIDENLVRRLGEEAKKEARSLISEAWGKVIEKTEENVEVDSNCRMQTCRLQYTKKVVIKKSKIK